MISCTRIGTHGHLGNQMFQYAVVKAVCARRGYEARIPRYAGLELTAVFDIPDPELTDNDVRSLVHLYKEPHFAYSDAVFDVPDNCNLQGYFQSQRYFEHCAAEIRASLAFKPALVAQADRVSSRLLGGAWLQPTTVSLHVRRGDYLALPTYHPVCPAEYYEQALGFMEERVGRMRVVVFSDDLEWCRETFRGRRYRFSDNDSGTDLLLMSRCDHHIIANSSFSWWGAWLNPSPDKIVIAPEVWFGPDCPQDSQDLRPPDWHLI
jgi:hypothetical protein